MEVDILFVQIKVCTLTEICITLWLTPLLMLSLLHMEKHSLNFNKDKPDTYNKTMLSQNGIIVESALKGKLIQYQYRSLARIMLNN